MQCGFNSKDQGRTKIKPSTNVQINTNKALTLAINIVKIPIIIMYEVPGRLNQLRVEIKLIDL